MTTLNHCILYAARAVAIIALASHPAAAHHAFTAEFDGNAPVLLKGMVTKVEWINPHCWIHLSVEAAGTPPQLWMVEGGTPNALVRNGVDRNSLKPGTIIIVRGYQAIDHRCTPECKANGRDLTFADGRKLFVGSSGTGAPDDEAPKPQ